jgi:hypothetical protein
VPLVEEPVIVPQLDREQLVLQVTPFAAESFSTTAIGCMVRPDPELVTERLDGKMLTDIGVVTGVVIVIVLLTDLLVSVTEVAVRVTVPPVGTADGAV